MSVDFYVVIPARYSSSRFPGKPLVDIHGKPMIQHVFERAVESGAEAVWIATDDQRIADVAEGFHANVCMTSSQHESGTDRIVEVVNKQHWPDSTLVVNVQGDEPFIPSENIRQLAENLAANEQASMATLSTPQDINDIGNPNIVKVVTDNKQMALYFSRAPIPYQRNDNQNLQKVTFDRHIGIYAYRVDYLKRFAMQQQAPLENIERLEQLRALWHGEKIHVATAIQAPPVGIDTPEDLDKLLNQSN